MHEFTDIEATVLGVTFYCSGWAIVVKHRVTPSDYYHPEEVDSEWVIDVSTLLALYECDGEIKTLMNKLNITRLLINELYAELSENQSFIEKLFEDYETN